MLRLCGCGLRGHSRRESERRWGGFWGKRPGLAGSPHSGSGSSGYSARPLLSGKPPASLECGPRAGWSEPAPPPWDRDPGRGRSPHVLSTSLVHPPYPSITVRGPGVLAGGRGERRKPCRFQEHVAEACDLRPGRQLGQDVPGVWAAVAAVEGLPRRDRWGSRGLLLAGGLSCAPWPLPTGCQTLSSQLRQAEMSPVATNG